MRSLLLATATALAAPALLASTATAAVTPPTPTGAAPIGFTRTILTDHHRSEPLAGDTGPRSGAAAGLVSGRAARCQPARTLSAAEQTGWETYAGAPAERSTASAPRPPPMRRPRTDAIPCC